MYKDTVIGYPDNRTTAILASRETENGSGIVCQLAILPSGWFRVSQTYLDGSSRSWDSCRSLSIAVARMVDLSGCTEGEVWCAVVAVVEDTEGQLLGDIPRDVMDTWSTTGSSRVNATKQEG